MIFLDEETLGINYFYRNQKENKEIYSHVEIALDIATGKERLIKFSELKNSTLVKMENFK